MRWTDPTQLWSYVSEIAQPRSRLVVVAHNLGFDLRISRALYILPTTGWHLKQFNLAARNVMVTWGRDDGARLVMIDSYTYLPMALAKVAKLVGRHKVDLPEAGDAEQWWERCETDVQILRDACRELWSMIENDNLGNWQRTGASMAWANWRHRHYTHKVLVHQDEGAKNAETQATATARCEAWRWGSFRAERYTEWDFPLSYPRVALDTSLPVALVGHLDKVPRECLSRATNGFRYLIRASVRTVSPVLPFHDPAGYAWPVGNFSGWYWDHELGAALEHGTDVTAHEAYMYRGKPALADWAQWVIGVAEGGGSDFTAVQQAAVKHWGRALIGRFAVRYSSWELFGQGLDGAVSAMTMHDHDTGTESTILLLGDEAYEAGPKIYGADSVPAINSAIVSEARIRLWDVMVAAGLENIYYVDTDCLIVNQAGDDWLAAKTADGFGWGIRVKRRHSAMKIYGPRAMTTNNGRKTAGIPRTAHRSSESRYVGEHWESLPSALARHRADSVVVSMADWKITGVDNRRLHLPGGFTQARTVNETVEAASAPRTARERSGA
jgi:hypothetical protein